MGLLNIIEDREISIVINKEAGGMGPFKLKDSYVPSVPLYGDVSAVRQGILGRILRAAECDGPHGYRYSLNFSPAAKTKISQLDQYELYDLIRLGTEVETNLFALVNIHQMSGTS